MTEPKVTPGVITVEGGVKERHQGVVKWSRGSFAWVESAAIARIYPGRDVFIHKNDCIGNAVPKQWERISFELTEDDLSNPKGLRARVETEEAKRARAAK